MQPVTTYDREISHTCLIEVEVLETVTNIIMQHEEGRNA